MFQLAKGSIPGRGHVLMERGNQDAVAVFQSGDRDRLTQVGVICDGCGSGEHSEVGAHLAAQTFAKSASQARFDRRDSADAFESQLQANFNYISELLMNNLGLCLGLMNQGVYADLINTYFLFTVMGFVVTPKFTAIFGLGDGVYALNNEIVTLGPYPGNQPPYLAYGSLITTKSIRQPQTLQIHRVLPTADLESLMIGSDGVTDLMMAERSLLPGTDQPVGHVSQFWTLDRYFNNPDMIRRKLAMANRRVGTNVGLLHDDTSLVSLRRVPDLEEV